jgi:uncharacterized protein (UPF0128 family)
MAINLAKRFEGKKFMWDGMTYETEEQAKEIKEKYKKDGFEVKIIRDGNQYLVYSRREVYQER